ncbi:tetratricopeptide repeat protein [Streptomyces krungchingensis]|uniref:tetratricopeptide repeat protein n=1 Tax=Streptomyces krungchingensis TaxID=1565034 RepID=UPI003CE9620F
MENEERQPVLTGLQPHGPAAPRRRPRTVRRVLIGVTAGGGVLAGVLVLLPVLRPATAPRPAPGSVARAMTAVGAGVPVALPDLKALIGDREAHVRAHPRDGQSWAVLGSAYLEQARRTALPAYYPKAEQALRTSLRVRTQGNVEALDGLAALANARGDFREAKKYGEAAVELAPKRWTTYPLLIDAYRGLGDFKASRKALDTLTALHTGPTVQAQASRVYWDRGWREDAMAVIMDAAAGAGTPAEQAVLMEQAGELAWERGEPDESLRYYRAAVRADPDDHGALAGQGRALAALGRSSEAVRAYREAIAKRPTPRYALELGELYEKLGMDADARTQYDLLRQRVRQESAEGVDDELVLGIFEADHGDPLEAVWRLREAWERHPSMPVADALGWALHRAGEDEEAIKFANRITDKEHGGGVRSALYMYHLGQIELSLDRTGSARRHLSEALLLNPHFSPLLVPQARQALADLGEPPAVGPEELEAEEEAPAEAAAGAPAPAPAPAPGTGTGAGAVPTAGTGGTPSGGATHTPAASSPAAPAQPSAGPTAGSTARHPATH